MLRNLMCGALIWFGVFCFSSIAAATDVNRHVQPVSVVGAGSIGTRRAIVAGGGNRSEAGSIRVTGSIGQSCAVVDPATATTLLLQGGYWTAAPPPQPGAIFSDSFE